VCCSLVWVRLPAILRVLQSLVLAVLDVARSRVRLHLELLTLRHQLHVLQRTRPRRVPLAMPDRLLWIWLSHVWRERRPALVIVEPGTVVACIAVDHLTFVLG
jgi:hypothetical protein